MENMEFKRYLVFGFDEFYPSGGMTDCHGRFYTFDGAKRCLLTINYDAGYIYDVITNKYYGTDEDEE
jgi:hypothetical protein